MISSCPTITTGLLRVGSGPKVCQIYQDERIWVDQSIDESPRISVGDSAFEGGRRLDKTTLEVSDGYLPCPGLFPAPFSISSSLEDQGPTERGSF
jgi:hypothetical protein